MRVSALDLAATTGVAWGELPAAPRLAIWSLEGARGCRGLYLMQRLIKHLDDYQPDLLAIEEPMSAAVQTHKGRSQDANISLTGYVFLAETLAWSRGIEVALIGRQSVLKHFTGRARYGAPKEAKRAVMARCRQLGWNPRDDNEGDAAALWDCASARRDPGGFVRAAQDRPMGRLG